MDAPGGNTNTPPADYSANGEGQQTPPGSPRYIPMHMVIIWAESTLIIVTICLSLLLLVIILARERLRQRVFNQMLVSIVGGSVIFNVLVRPGTIKDEDETYEMNKSYCSIYLLLQRVEWLFMPLAFWMLSIDRLFALRQPETYSQRMTKGVRAALIGVPWTFAFSLSILIVFIISSQVITRYGPYPDDPYFDEMSRFVSINCMVIHNHTMSDFVHILWDLIGCAIPVLALFITSFALVIVYFRRRGVKVCDDIGELLVAPGSIVLCLILNTVAMIILIENSIQMSIGYSPFAGFIYTHWAWSAVELLMAILIIAALPDVRHVAGGVCCCCIAPNDEKLALLPESKDTQTSPVKPDSEP